MKHLFTILISFFIGLNIFSQQEDLKLLKQKIEETPYVVEGTILNVEIYAGDTAGNKIPLEDAYWEGNRGTFKLEGQPVIGYSKATIQVCKVYKGIIKTETIDILTSSQSLQPYLLKLNGKDTLVYNYWSNSHINVEIILPRNSIGKRHIFFLKKHVNIDSYEFIGVGSINFNLQYKESTNDEYKKIFAFSGGEFYNFKDKFYSKSDLNDFLNQFSSLSIKGENKCNPVNEKKNVGLSEYSEKETEINYEQQVNNYNNWLKKSYEKLQLINKQNNHSKMIAEGLILEIANPRLSGPNASQVFLEFDIMASGTSNSTYFDNCLMRIKYNSAAFGTNLVANGNVTITADPAFPLTTYINPQTNTIDQGVDTLGIPFGVDFNSTNINRTAITIFPKKMLTIKMRIQNCNILAAINFVETSFTSIFSFYTLNSTAPITAGTSYNTTQYNGSITDKTCEPIITGFSDNIPAGIGATFTVNGRYFGSSKSSGTIIFKNANKGSVYPIGNLGEGIESYDVISWKDDEIKIRLPSIIDSIATLKSDPHYQPTPGSGYFKVKNKYGYYKESATKLTIPYAVYQAITMDNNGKFTKVVPELAGINDSSGYTIHLHPNVSATYPKARAVIKKALRDWQCASGINWQLGKDTAISPSVNDGVSLIYVANTPGLMATSHGFGTCNTNPYRYYMADFDIGINPNFLWQLDTTGNILSGNYDFYHAIAHELGHGHLLFHANDSINGIMFWAAASGFIAAGNRKMVKTSVGAVQGAQYVANNLIGGVSGCYLPHQLNYLTNCGGLSISENENGSMNIDVFPNPINTGNLTIKTSLEEETQINLLVFDVSGKALIHKDFGRQSQFTYYLPIEDLAKGVYFIKMIIGYEYKTFKFIKE